MRVMVIEDEAVASRALVRMLRQLRPGVEIVATTESVSQSADFLKKAPAPELIFMDIHLSDGLCFDLFEELDITSPIIFTTAYDTYAVKAFELNSLDYLLKPFSVDRLQQALDKFDGMNQIMPAFDIEALRQMVTGATRQYKSRFLIRTGKKLTPISVGQIACFLKDDLVFLVSRDGKTHAINYALDELENLLDPSLFFRLNRQVLAHYDAIESVSDYAKGKLAVRLGLASSEPVIVSKERAARFKAWLDQ